MMLLQIVWPDGRVVRVPAGGPIEKELIDDVVNRMRTRRVGLLKNKAQVCAEVEAAMRESFSELKNRTLQGFE